MRYKAGFFRQDQTFLQWVCDGGTLPFPGCDLDDAVKTMEMIDAIISRINDSMIAAGHGQR